MKLRGFTRGALLTGGVAFLIVGGVVVAIYLFFIGNELAALFVSNILVVSVLGLVLAILVYTDRRQRASSRSRRREHQELQNALERGAGNGSGTAAHTVESALRQLGKRQDHLHALTRKRIREKHNATQATLSRTRRRNYKQYATMKQRIEHLAKEQSQQAEILGGDSAVAEVERPPIDADRGVLRAFLFEMMESQAQNGGAPNAPASDSWTTEGEAKDA